MAAVERGTFYFIPAHVAAQVAHVSSLDCVNTAAMSSIKFEYVLLLIYPLGGAMIIKAETGYYHQTALYF